MRKTHGSSSRVLLPWQWASCVFPLCMGLFVFTYIPIIISFVTSFFSMHNSLRVQGWVGVKNYLDEVQDPNFQASIGTFVGYTLVVVPAIFALSLTLALLVHASGKRMQILWRTIFLIPTACSTVAAAIIWKMSLFNGVRFGFVNTVLKLFGHKPIAWLISAHPPWYWLVIISMRLWLQSGFYMLIFLAALGRINPQLYEAASLDGAHRFRENFRYITWPALKPASIAVLVLLTFNTFQAFDEFYNLIGSTTGYPPYARPPLIYLYYTSMGESQDFSHSNAGVFLLITGVIIVYIIGKQLYNLGNKLHHKRVIKLYTPKEPV